MPGSASVPLATVGRRAERAPPGGAEPGVEHCVPGMPPGLPRMSGELAAMMRELTPMSEYDPS